MKDNIKTRTLKRTKINGIRCYLKKCYIQNTTTGEELDLWYYITANDGIYKKILDPTQAIDAYLALIEFEKRQLSL